MEPCPQAQVLWIRAAVNMATGYFDDGAASNAETKTDMKILPNYESFPQMDKERIDMAERRQRDETKARRIELRRRKATRMETEKKREGTTYKAGFFVDDIAMEGPPPKMARTDKESKQPASHKGSKKPARGRATTRQVAPDEAACTINCR